MAMIVGDAASNTGMAGAMWTALLATNPVEFSNPAVQTKLQQMCNAMAQGIVPYIQANAVPTLIIPASLGGLQKTTTPGVLTDPPGGFNISITGGSIG